MYKYKFMQIYGNCAAVHYLPEDRLRGPVDNVIAKGLDCIQLLLEDKYLGYILNTEPIIKKRKPNYIGDSILEYDYPYVSIVHQNPQTDKYKIELEKRCNNFNTFLKNIYKQNYYFVYSLNINDLNNKTHKLISNTLENNIKYLQDKNLLEKTIFVGTVGNNWWDFWSNDFIKLIKKYNLKYIEINDVGMGICDNTKTQQQFNKKVTDVINNGTNLNYLRYRNKNERNNYMKYYIMCGGNYKNFKDLPKHFTKVNGEPVINRTIRLLLENGIAKENIIITSNNPIFKKCGVTVLTREENTFTQDAPWTNMKGYWVDAFYPSDEPITYLFGDVFYSKKAIKIIIESKTSSILFFGNNGKSKIAPKAWQEPLGFKVVDQNLFKTKIQEVKKLFDQGKVKRHPIAWELYRHINGYNINTNILDKNYINILDISTDVDKPEDAAKIEKLIKLYGEDLKEPKNKPIKNADGRSNCYLYF